MLKLECVEDALEMKIFSRPLVCVAKSDKNVSTSVASIGG
jgi:hypothetical protein